MIIEGKYTVTGKRNIGRLEIALHNPKIVTAAVIAAIVLFIGATGHQVAI